MYTVYIVYTYYCTVLFRYSFHDSATEPYALILIDSTYGCLKLEQPFNLLVNDHFHHYRTSTSMWVKQCHKPPMTGNGGHIPPIYGDDWGMVNMALFFPLFFLHYHHFHKRKHRQILYLHQGQWHCHYQASFEIANQTWQ